MQSGWVSKFVGPRAEYAIFKDGGSDLISSAKGHSCAGAVK